MRRKCQWGGQRNSCRYKRVGIYIIVTLITLIVNMINGFGNIQANAADEIQNNQIVKSGEYENITWTIDNNGLLTLAPKEGTNGHFQTYSSPSWLPYENHALVKKCNIAGKIYVDGAACRLFSFESLTEIDNIHNLDTSAATNLSEMFLYDKNLKTIDVSNFNTLNVYAMGNMFSGCTSLTSLDVSNFNTSNVETMAFMFYACENLKTIDVSHFDTSKVTDMRGMFQDCDHMQILNVSNFDTSKVTDMMDMFNGCGKLKTIDVSHFDTSKVTNMRGMFSMRMSYGPALLQELHVENFNTSNVTDMGGMFEDCVLLKNIDVSKFNTSNVKWMYRMFRGCNSLTYLDLSNFDTVSVLKNVQEHIDNGDAYREYFFSQMFPLLSESKLRTITIGSKCSTLVTTKNNTVYKYGIQYVLPQINSNDTTQYIIRQKEGKYGPYTYSFKRDANKKYETGIPDVEGNLLIPDSSYDSDFADNWKPEMAGTWIITSDNAVVPQPTPPSDQVDSPNSSHVTNSSESTNSIDTVSKSTAQPNQKLVQTGIDASPFLFPLIASPIALLIARRRCRG